jgi:lipid A ethanolaminephosphotransferase
VAVLLVAAFVLVCLNAPFWRMLYAAVAPNTILEWLFLGSVFAVGMALLNLLFGAFAIPYLFKPVTSVFLLIAAAASYFIGEYGVAIDAGLIRNIIETNPAEVRDLVTIKLLGYLVMGAALPTWLLWRARLHYRSLRSEFAVKTLGALFSVVVVVAAIFPFTNNFMSVFREQRHLLYFFTPINSLHAVYKYIQKSTPGAPAIVASFGEDAHKDHKSLARQGRSLTVIVVGETARAANFSLNGYPRLTNPLLSKMPDLVSFSRAYSCGTDTAHSLPCMFSGLGRAGFDPDRAARREGLLDILQRAGFSVLWRENQSGCKGVCSRVPTEVLVETKLPKFYEVSDAMDEALLDNLRAKIADLDRDGVFVLHMMGSHGPAYYKRYPKQFEHFKPTCKESQFSRCTSDEIVNAYDNSIVYTDYVLAHLIDLLRAQDQEGIATAFIYLSDHGESLGEGNIYLHAMPYALAPDVQTHIPMLLWLSPKYQTWFGVDMPCIAGRGDQRVSHDNLFHSVLGLLDIETKVYNAKLDIFTGCRRASE